MGKLTAFVESQQLGLGDVQTLIVRCEEELGLGDPVSRACGRCEYESGCPDVGHIEASICPVNRKQRGAFSILREEV